MNALVVYDSQYGNTERLARAIADTLREFAQARVVHVDPAHPADLRDVDLFIVGSPTQGWRPTPNVQVILERISAEHIGGAAVACFDTRFRLLRWMTGSAAGLMAGKLRDKGVPPLVPPESFFVKGTEGLLRDGELNRATAWARMLVEEVEAPPPATPLQPR